MLQFPTLGIAPTGSSIFYLMLIYLFVCLL